MRRLTSQAVGLGLPNLLQLVDFMPSDPQVKWLYTYSTLTQLGPTNTLKQMSETLQPSLLPEKVRKETFEDFFGNDLMYDIRT